MTPTASGSVRTEHALQLGARPPKVQVPVRGSSVLTGRNRPCHAELVEFASPIGRLSAILRITDPTTGKVGTSVVPVDLPVRIERTRGIAQLVIAPGDVRACDLRAETEAVRLLVRLPAGTAREELERSSVDRLPAHEQALALTTALSGGALATA